MRFVSNISALFVVAGSHGLDTNPAAVRLFRKRSAKGFGRKGFGSSFSDIVRLMRFVGNISALFVVAVSHGFWCLTFHSGPLKVLEAHSAPNAFRRQRFGIVRGRWFAWFGHESCCCSAVSQAVRQRLWTQRFWKLIQRHCSPNAFRRQHFGIVRGRCFAWFRHESCCCSAVAQAVRQRLGTLVLMFDIS